MKYESRGLTFTIEELDETGQRIFNHKLLATQDLTEEQRSNPNYLREVYSADTEEEIKSIIDNSEGFKN